MTIKQQFCICCNLSWTSLYPQSREELKNIFMSVSQTESEGKIIIQTLCDRCVSRMVEMGAAGAALETK